MELLLSRQTDKSAPSARCSCYATLANETHFICRHDSWNMALGQEQCVRAQASLTHSDALNCVWKAMNTVVIL
jgi:hypothetical protein